MATQHSFSLILASQSPRRAELLREAGFAFEQRSPPFADPDQPPADLHGDHAEAYAQQLAEQKAQSLAGEMNEPALILAADTICVDHQGVLLGKPIDQADAGDMLRRFRDHPHRVITGVALLNSGGGDQPVLRGFADTATVTFGRIDDGQIASYVQTDGWQGKAGGYNLFDRQAAGWPIQVAGDPTTVVGLPMRRLAVELQASLHSDA